MYRSTYLREVHKEKYEWSDALEHQSLADFSLLGLSQAQGLENLQELNQRFANYINRARVLEQRNAIFRKQLETFQRMDEISGLEVAFEEQIEVNRQRIRELSLDHAKLEREYKDAQRMVDEFRNKYRNECEYQLVLRETLERLNKEADEALLCNLELQIESQFLQDDINATKDRYKKNLMEIQTYVNILQQIIQTTPRVNVITAGTHEEKLMSERKIPILQSQLEEYKTILCQLQAQKSKLQTETTMLEQAIKNTQESYDDEIQLYNEQIDTLRKGIEEGERSLEKYTNDCRQLLIYEQSLENELERNKRIIENEDNRLNSAIVGTPITLFTQSYRSSYTQAARGKDITMAIQDISTAKPRQKGLPKKAFRNKGNAFIDMMEIDKKVQVYGKSVGELGGQQKSPSSENHSQNQTRQDVIIQQLEGTPSEDVPDGAQFSKAFNHLCSMVQDKMRGHKKLEHASEYYTKGRYVLVTGEGSYLDPCFYSSSREAGSGTTVIISNGAICHGNDVMPIPEVPEPHEPADHVENETSSDDEKETDPKDQRNTKGAEKDKEDDQSNESENKKDEPKKPSDVTRPEPSSHSGASDQHHDSLGNRKVKYSDTEDRSSGMPCRDNNMPGSMSYEKVEVLESIEKISDDRVETYEETAMIVETMIEKTSKKKQGGS
ncbi:filensin [Pleurodeles waltl]|uniref:filensin n=1 Tax=Pleurodeles waltl TaxID=8319 RepID=UPI0037095141